MPNNPGQMLYGYRRPAYFGHGILSISDPGQVTAITRTATWNEQQTITFTRTALWSEEPWYLDLPVCPYDPNSSPVFRRLFVDYMVKGGARVSWQLDPNFNDPSPTTYSYQLQTSPSGVATADDWVNVGNPMVNVFFLQDPNQRLYGKTAVTHYRIVLTTSVAVYISQIASVLGQLDEYGFLLVREVLRKEELRHSLFGSLPGFLLKRRRYGTPAATVDQLTGEVIATDDLISYGTEFIDGFYAPLSCSFATMETQSNWEHRNLQGTGTERKMVAQGRMLGFPPLTAGDIFVARNSDIRYYIQNVKELAIYRGIPLIYEAELRQAPYSDIIYTIPLYG